MRALPLVVFISPLACSPYAAPPTLPPSPPPPASAPSPAPSQPVFSAPRVEEPSAPKSVESAADDRATPDETPSAFPAFEVEAPYLPGKYPRPTGRMAASIADEELARWNLGGSSQSTHPSNRPNYHPAPRVVVDLKALGRSLPERTTRARGASAASLLAEARNQGYWPFRTCFEQGLRENAELSGQVQIRVRIAASGRVASARLHGSPLRSHQTVECVLRAASALSFKKAPPRRVDVELSVKFWPGDATLPPRDERVTATWDPSATFTAVSAESSELARCCVDALGRDSRLWGRLAFTVQTDSSGHVQESRESESRFPDHEASECMRAALTRLPPLPTGARQFVIALRCGRPAVPEPTPPPDVAPRDNAEGSELGEPGSLPARPLD